MRGWIVASIMGSLLAGPAAFAADSWPQWRGPSGQGLAEASGLPVIFGEGNNVTWKTAIPGKAWSSPVIADGQVWMTTAIDTPADPSDISKRLETNTGDQPLVVSAEVSLRAVCVDQKTGALLHDIELMVEPSPQWVHTLNSYASPTPVLDDGKLYCHFGTYGTCCLDTKTLKVLWTQRDLRIMHENGPGSTPVVWGDRVIFHCDGSDVQYIVGLDKKTGEVAWKTPRSGEMHDNPQYKKSYGTPLVVEVDGEPQLISPASDWVYAYDPQTGKELWRVSYGILGFSQVARPIVGHGMVYICTAFGPCELQAIRLPEGGKPAEIAWRYKKQVPKMSSPVLVGDSIYFVSDKGVGTCVDAHTGEEKWMARVGGNYCSSPFAADGKIYFFSREGECVVLAAGPEYRELARNRLDGSVMASPAFADGAMFVRTEHALYRIE
jgi:outer membrane protein assembly factor BamB